MTFPFQPKPGPPPGHRPAAKSWPAQDGPKPRSWADDEPVDGGPGGESQSWADDEPVDGGPGGESQSWADDEPVDGGPGGESQSWTDDEPMQDRPVEAWPVQAGPVEPALMEPGSGAGSDIWTDADPAGIAPDAAPGTGHPAVDVVLRSLANAAQLPPAEQIGEYEAAHQVLQETLASIDG